MKSQKVVGHGWRGIVRVYKTAAIVDVGTTDRHYRATAPAMQVIYFPKTGVYRWRCERPASWLARAVELVLFAAFECEKSKTKE